MEPYLDKAYHLYVDNCWTYLKLIQDLSERKTYAFGTIRPNRGEFPKSYKDAALDVGESTFIQMKNIVAVHWKDKRDVFVMSSINGNQTEIIERYKGEIEKPSIIQEYNPKMGGVDKCDQRLSYYCPRGKKDFPGGWNVILSHLWEKSFSNTIEHETYNDLIEIWKLKFSDIVNIDEKEKSDISIRRSSLYTDTLKKIRRILKKGLVPINIVFTDEDSDDSGGPTRDFFTEVFDLMVGKLVHGESRKCTYVCYIEYWPVLNVFKSKNNSRI